MKLDNSQKLKVGIPRGLFYYRDFPFWKTFFEEIGAEVLVSPKTNAQVLKEGIAHLTGDVCLPVKAFCGHVLTLVKDCDFILIPSIYSLEEKVYNCPKFIGLPDLMKSVLKNSANPIRKDKIFLNPTLSGNKEVGLYSSLSSQMGSSNGVKILEIDINFEKGKIFFYQDLEKLAQNFTNDFKIIKLAIERAEKTQNIFEGHNFSFLSQTKEKLCLPQEEKEQGKEGSILTTIGLVGHPYLIYDDYLSHNLIEILQKLKIKVLLPTEVSKTKLRKSLLKLTDRPYWTFEDEIVGAGVYFLEKKTVSGLICLSAFGCGPDSMMIELLKRYAKEKKKILLHLNLDEQTAEAGLTTRIEAFVDSLPRSEISLLWDLNQRKEIKISPHSTNDQKRGKIKILGIPNMGEKFSIFGKDFQRNFSITLISPPVTQRTITLGNQYSPDDACLPFKATLGSLIECLQQGADTLLMVTSFNACRMGYYSKVQEKVLKDLGYNFSFFKLHSKNRGIRGFLSSVKKLTNNAPWLKILSFSLLAVVKLRVLEQIEKRVQEIRPLEVEKGSADKIYQESFKTIEKAKNIFQLLKVKKELLKRLKEIKKDEKFRPLKIGIVGELYVVAEPLVNMDLEKELGKRGVLVERPKSTFFSEYTRPFHFNPLGQEKKRLEKLTKFYLKRDVGGHGLESLGLKIEYSQKGYDGIVHLLPFTCLPETIAQNIMITTKEKIPVLTISCDTELAKAGLITRIEAFVDLLSSHRTNRNLKA